MDSRERGDQTDERADSWRSRGAWKDDSHGWYILANMVFTDAFVGTLILFMILLVIEVISKDSGAYFVNLDTVMWVVIGAGVLSLLTSGARECRASTAREKEISHSDVLLAVVLGFLSTALILFITLKLGSISLLVSMSVGIVLILVSPLLV